MGLYDRVLIKENHIAAAGSITQAIAAARRTAPGITVEVEVESLAEFAEALDAQPDIVMLDEFSHADMRTAVARNHARGRPVLLEASGSVSLQNVRAIAETGVDYVSVGSLTKHVRAVDLSMRLEFTNHDHATIGHTGFAPGTAVDWSRAGCQPGSPSSPGAGGHQGAGG